MYYPAQQLVCVLEFFQQYVYVLAVSTSLAQLLEVSLYKHIGLETVMHWIAEIIDWTLGATVGPVDATTANPGLALGACHSEVPD